MDADRLLREANEHLKNALMELSEDIEKSGDRRLIEKARDIQDALANELNG